MSRRSFLRDERGAVVVVATLAMPILIGFAALATDFGYVFLEKRQMQSAADMAVLSAAGALPENAERTARMVLDENGYSRARFVLKVGTVDQSAQRDYMFTEGGSGGALSLTVVADSRIFLSSMFVDQVPVVEVRSDAMVRPVSTLAAGSRLLSLKKGIANTILGAATGSKLDIGLVSYEGLATSKIELGDLLREIAAQTGLSGKTVGQVLDSVPTIDVVATAASAILDRNGKPGQAALARDFARTILKAKVKASLGELFHVDESLRSLAVSYPSAALSTDVSVLSVVQAAVSDAGIGNRIEIPLAVPLLGRADVRMLLGEAEKTTTPRISLGGEDSKISTAQVRTRMEIATADAVAGLGVGVSLPLELVVAGGTAHIVDVECGLGGGDRRAVVMATPGAAKLEIGAWKGDLEDAEVKPHKEFARILDLPLVKVEAYAVASIREEAPVRLVFDETDIRNGKVKTARTTRFLSSLTADLLRRTEIRVKIVGIGIGLGAGFVQNAVASLIEPLSAPLDGLLAEVLSVAGTSVGEMDVRVDDVSCTAPRLAG